jgi:hypothetical protein
METAQKLELSVHELIEVYHKLRNNREKTLQDIETIKNELAKAKETIRELKLSSERIEEITKKNNNLDKKKNEIIERIKLIVLRLERIEQTDNITNE